MPSSRVKIAGAFMIGSVLIASAFLMSKSESAAQGNVATVIVPEREFIAIEDSNDDGIPDWREALQKTEAIIIDNTASGTYKAPQTITGKFAQQFLQDLLSSRTYGQFGASNEELVVEATNELIDRSQDVLFTTEDISLIESTDANIIRAYGNHIATISLSQNASKENEAIILQNALRYNEPERLEDLEPIAASYTTIVKQMLEVSVPASYAQEHLALLNAYNAVREDVNGMQKVYEDPLYTLIRMKRYQDDVLGLYNALSKLFDALYLKDKIEWGEGEPASTLTDMLQTI